MCPHLGRLENDLVDSVRARIASPDALVCLDSIAVQKLGKDWQALDETTLLDSKQTTKEDLTARV